MLQTQEKAPTGEFAIDKRTREWVKLYFIGLDKDGFAEFYCFDRAGEIVFKRKDYELERFVS